MKEYVDLEQKVEAQFYDEMCEEFSIKTETIGHILDSVCDNYEIADVVEVVRCKDCKYWGSALAPDDLARAKTEQNNDIVCDMWMSDGFTPNDYCSFAERR